MHLIITNTYLEAIKHSCRLLECAYVFKVNNCYKKPPDIVVYAIYTIGMDTFTVC